MDKARIYIELDRMNLVSKSRPVSGLGFLWCWPRVTILGTNSLVSWSISGLVTDENQNKHEAHGGLSTLIQRAT